MGKWLALTALALVWSAEAGAQCDDPLTVDLLAGQTSDVGSVSVCNDEDTLTITYEATYPWCLLTTDLHVGLSEPGIPQNRSGNPIRGHFDYGDDYGGCLAGPATFEIPLANIGDGALSGDPVVIAAHAEVSNGEREEGAWGAGTRFVQRGNWATWFTHIVQEPTCNVPGGSCTVFVTSTFHNGDLGGLDGADEICQDRAADANLPGTFKAWLADDTGSPATGFVQATVPYVRTDSIEIASDWADLTDAATCPLSGLTICLSAPINRTEAGVQISGTGLSGFVWSNTGVDGFTQTFAQNQDCSSWSTAASG